MSARRPLVRITGKTRQMPAGETLPSDCLPASISSDMGSSDAAKGWTQKDRSNGKTYRIFVDNGIMGIEEV